MWQGLSQDASLGLQSRQAMATNIFTNLILSDLCCSANPLQPLLLPGQIRFTVDQGGLKWMQICGSMLLGRGGAVRRGNLRKHYGKHFVIARDGDYL